MLASIAKGTAMKRYAFGLAIFVLMTQASGEEAASGARAQLGRVLFFDHVSSP
jgi:hypothetical protein